MIDAPVQQKKSILFEPSPKQQEFLEAVFSGKYRVVLFGGAIRGGKTYAGLGALLLLCKFYPGSIWAVVRATLPSLKQTTIKSFKKICPVKFIETYNQETQTVTFTNGSQLIFFSENYDDDKDLDRWKGLEVSGFLLEECNELSEDAFWKAIERAGSFIPRDNKKPPPLVAMTCNPANNWVKKLIYDRAMGRPDPEGKLGPLPEKWLYIPSKITDNPYAMADADYIESINSMPEYKRQVYVEGNWDIQLKVGGEYFKCFDLDKHVRKVGSEEEVKYNPALPLHVSFDDNVNPYLPCGIFQFDITPHILEGGKSVNHYNIYMIDEIAGINPNNTISAVCREVVRKYPKHEAGMFIYGDATADKEDTKLEKGFNFYRLILDNLRQYKPTLMVLSSNPAVYMRGNWMNTVFEKEIGHLKFLVSDICKNAINDFILLKEDENGGKAKAMETDPKTKVRYQKVGHFADLLEYFMCSRFAAQFQSYMAGGAMNSITYGRNKGSKNSYN
jgi:hypothetical protein